MQINLQQLTAAPTVINRVHESLYRSAQLLRVVKELLAAGTPPAVVLALIEGVEAFPPKAEELANG